MRKNIFIVGINHRGADVAVRESFALSDSSCSICDIVPLDSEIEEAFVLSTCNRVEIAVVGGEGADPREKVISLWASKCGGKYADLAPHVYAHVNREAVAHLFSVASGLDSLVLGEPQILGQLKDAYRKALDEKTAKVILNRLLHKAFMTAKRVRTETGISSNAVSVSYAAVSLAKRIFGDLAGKKVLIIGAGEMAELAAAHLTEGQGADIAVTNRTHERAVTLAARFGGKALPFEDIFTHIAASDIIITSTGAPDPLITLERMRSVMKGRRAKPLFIIDIAVPRDVEDAVNTLDNVYLYNIDDLAEVVEANRAARREEAGKAKEIIAEEAGRFCSWLNSLGLHGTIADIVHRAEDILDEELSRTLRRLGPLPPGTEDALRQMTAAMAKKLNHAPISYLKRRYAEEDGMRFVTLARAMFDLDDEAVPEDAHFGRKRKV